MRIIRSDDYRRMPWKNGGGETAEIAVGPAGASLDALDWRVSMARVAASGPFSRFPGIDRTLAVLEGAGIRLSLAGREAVPLGPDTPPFGFSGDDPAEAELIDGPIEDLNVMTRRASHRHRLSRLAASAPVSLRREGEFLLVVARGAAARASAAGEAHALAEGATVLLDQRDAPRLEIAPAAPARLYVIELWRV
jgi:environmental stress-induced protein Ves